MLSVVNENKQRTITLQASQSPEKPTNLKVQRIYTTSVLISWNDVLGFMYKVIAVPNFLMEKNCDNGGTPNATSPVRKAYILIFFFFNILSIA